MKSSNIKIASRAVSGLLENKNTRALAEQLVYIIAPGAYIDANSFVDAVEEDGSQTVARKVLAAFKKNKKSKKKRKKKGKTKKKSSKKDKDYAKKYRKAHP